MNDKPPRPRRTPRTSDLCEPDSLEWDRLADLRRDYERLGELLASAQGSGAAAIARERRQIGDRGLEMTTPGPPEHPCQPLRPVSQVQTLENAPRGMGVFGHNGPSERLPLPSVLALCTALGLSNRSGT